MLETLAVHLERSAPQFDLVEIVQLRRTSALLALGLPHGWQRQVAQDEPHPVLDLRDLAAIPKAMRDNLRYCRRRTERPREVRCQLAHAGELAEVLDALARLHAQRWWERGEPGVLGDRVLAAHRESVPQLHAAGLLRLYALRLERSSSSGVSSVRVSSAGIP